MCVICKPRLAIRLTVMLCGRCCYIKTKLKHILALHVSRLASLWILRLDNLGKSCIRKLGESPSWYHHWLHSNKSLLPALTCCSAWNNGDPRGLFAVEKLHPHILISTHEVDFELCSYCCILCSSRFSSFGLIPSKTCVIVAGCAAWRLIRWPCGLTKTRTLSCLSRPLSGSTVTE